MLEQYAVLSTHYNRLCDELSDALNHFVLFPRQLPADVTWVPELLRTKLLPEQEKDMLALLTALNAAEAASASSVATSSSSLDFDESLGHRVANV